MSHVFMMCNDLTGRITNVGPQSQKRMSVSPTGIKRISFSPSSY